MTIMTDEWRLSGGWTAQRVEQLTDFWKEGQSASQIARHFGHSLSRNSVISKIHRMGLVGANSGTAGARHTYGSAPRTPRVRAPLAVRTIAAEPEPIGELNAFSAFGTCIWIHGDPNTGTDWRCCGHPRERPERPYCEFHTDRATSQSSASIKERTVAAAGFQRQFAKVAMG
jgi:hypothetical protein